MSRLPANCRRGSLQPPWLNIYNLKDLFPHLLPRIALKFIQSQESCGNSTAMLSSVISLLLASLTAAKAIPGHSLVHYNFLRNSLHPLNGTRLVTVGATSIAAEGDETVAIWPDSASSGGCFYNLFPTPGYQTKDTAAFIKSLGNQYKGRFNLSGRGFPNVSLPGTHYPIVVNGRTLEGTVGTSASSPAWTALVAQSTTIVQVWASRL